LLCAVAAATGVIPEADEPSALSEEDARELLEANRQLSELASAAIEDSAMLRQQVAQLAARDAANGTA
jgi:hypothetical protein